MEKDYAGDWIKIKKLYEYLDYDEWTWNDGQPIYLKDITAAIIDHHPEEAEPYGDTYKHPFETKSNDWHIGRVIYYINHPEEILGIELDNPCFENMILPQIFVVDGNHRWMAARWLYEKGMLDEICCTYGGRIDVLEYLKGVIEEMPNDVV